MIKALLATSLLVFGLFIPHIHAAQDQLFPDQITAEKRDFHKLGEYRYVYSFIFDLYDAALFAPKNSSADDVLEATTSFRLQFRYLRKIKKDIILKSADRMLKKNLSPAERERIGDRVDRINRAYTTVQKGDTSALTFHPRQGTTLRVNNEPKLTIEGLDFARLYFRIWLGPRAISESLKTHLLGRNQ